MHENPVEVKGLGSTDAVAVVDESFSSSDSVFMVTDPMHSVGQLNVARKKPVRVKPAAGISEALTLMIANDFSQLPVMSSSRVVRGIFSWRSFAQKIYFGKKPAHVKDAMEEPAIIESNQSLFQAAQLVARSDCVLIKEEDGTISGILTSYDLSVAFAERSEPFLLLELIEKHIRKYIDGKLSVSDMRDVRDSLDAKDKVSEATGLSFGDYVRILRKPEQWKKLGLPLDQNVFIEKLEEARRIRNKVMHFTPNGIAQEDLGRLRDFAGLFTQIQEIMS